MYTIVWRGYFPASCVEHNIPATNPSQGPVCGIYDSRVSFNLDFILNSLTACHGLARSVPFGIGNLRVGNHIIVLEIANCIRGFRISLVDAVIQVYCSSK